MVQKPQRRPLLPHAISVYKDPPTRMWVGACECGKEWHFWFFGATLGYGLEHLRRAS